MSYHGDPNHRPPYPLGVPSKFAPHTGAVQRFPGNTIVAHVREEAHPALYASLLRLHSALAAHQAGWAEPLLTLLPPSSWHMTVFDGVCDAVRDGPGGEGKGIYWPAGPFSGASLDACTASFTEKLRQFSLTGTKRGNRQYQGPPYRMSLAGWEGLTVGVAVHVEPRDDNERERLLALRDRLSFALGIRTPHHDHYGLHISVAYFVRWMNDEEERAIRGLLDRFWDEEWRDGAHGKDFELGAPEWCTFDDMFAFKRIFYLGDSETAGTDGEKGQDA